MRIVFILPGASGGGVRSVVRIAAGLADRGHRVRLLHKQPARSVKDRLRALYLRCRYDRREHWLHEASCECASYDRLTEANVGENDVIVGVGVTCTLAVTKLPRSCGIAVQNCRGVEPWIADDMDRAWRLSMPRIVVASHLERLIRRNGSRDPIYIAHNGVDATSYFSSLPATKRRGVGTVYHGGDVKDPALILHVLRCLAKSRSTVPLYVFGSFPRPRGLPRAATYVRFPSLSDARDLYSRSLVWFVGSRDEGLANPLLEAAACGCAIVSTDCGGSSDIIIQEVNGLITPVGDANAMLVAIGRLLDDHALRERLAAKSARTVQEFSWPKAVERFEAALEDIVRLAGRSTPIVQASSTTRDDQRVHATI